MKDWAARRVRYQRDTPPTQLGGLASNLSRIVWCAQRQNRDEAAPLFRESKYFAEWAAASCSLEQQELLAELQLELALWERGWGNVLSPASIAHAAQQWSLRLLESAGLTGADS